MKQEEIVIKLTGLNNNKLPSVSDIQRYLDFNGDKIKVESFSQQPTEKTREGAIKDLQNADIIISGTGNLTKPHRREAVAIIDFLIHKGINLEPYSQTENTNTPTLQSDSVDAELKSFLEFIAKERDAFVTEFLSVPTTTKRRVMAENFLIAYDQMKERLAGSKVKPVNEKYRALLEKVLRLKNDGISEIWKEIESALSTAPDESPQAKTISKKAIPNYLRGDTGLPKTF